MNKKPYFRIDKSFLRDPNISPAGKVLYIFVLDRQRMSVKNAERYTDKKGRLFCYLRQSEISSWTGLSESTVRRTFKELEKHDLLIIKRQGREMPNFIYPLINGQFVTGQIEGSRPVKLKGLDRSNLPPIKNESIKNESIKEKREYTKKTSPFLTRPRSDIIDLIMKIIKDEYLINLMSNAKDQAVNYYANRQSNEWKIGRKTIMNDDDLKLDLIGWNHKEKQFKDRGEVADKSKEKKKGEPEWMDDVMDGLSKMQG